MDLDEDLSWLDLDRVLARASLALDSTPVILSRDRRVRDEVEEALSACLLVDALDCGSSLGRLLLEPPADWVGEDFLEAGWEELSALRLPFAEVDDEDAD